MLLFGAVGWAAAENPSEQPLEPLWTEARLGNHDAQYGLGRHYERRYWLAEHDPDTPSGDPIDIVLSHGLFRMAEQSGELDAVYGRHSTEYRLKQFFGDEKFMSVIAGLPEWMRMQGLPPIFSSGDVAAAAARVEPAAAERGQRLMEAPSQPEEQPNSRVQSPAGTAFLQPEALMARGNTLLDKGDPISARVFLEMAAERGSGKAAMLVAMTYDPDYLASLGTTPGSDPRMATIWYRKASEMGYEGATARLEGLQREGQEVSP